MRTASTATVSCTARIVLFLAFFIFSALSVTIAKADDTLSPADDRTVLESTDSSAGETPARLKPAFMNLIRCGILKADDDFSLGLAMIFGHQFTDITSLGLGVGYESRSEGNWYPVFLDSRISFLRGRNCPYFLFEGGYTFSGLGNMGSDIWGGGFVQYGVGIRLQEEKGVGFALDFCLRHQWGGYHDGPGGGFTGKEANVLYCFSVGLSFD